MNSISYFQTKWPDFFSFLHFHHRGTTQEPGPELLFRKTNFNIPFIADSI